MQPQLNITFALSLMAIAATTRPADAQCVHQESNGLVMIDVESVPPAGGWVAETSVPGYTGDSYYRWNGPDLFNSPGSGVLTYELEIHQAGTYNLRIRNHHSHPDTTLENDLFARMDGGPWVKVFSYQFNTWEFISIFDYPNGNQPQADYVLDAGQHVFEISGRSHNFRIDRIHLFKWSAPNPYNPDQPQSPCESAPTEPGTAYCFGVGCPCGNDDPGAGCRNSTGKGAKLTAAGSTSIQAADLMLQADGLPSGETGLFFMGSRDRSPLHVDDGMACTGGLYRFTPGTVSPNGEMNLVNPAGLTPMGQIRAGDTRFFQTWTRDTLCGPPPMPCPSPCGSNSNLSNGYRVTFTP